MKKTVRFLLLAVVLLVLIMDCSAVAEALNDETVVTVKIKGNTMTVVYYGTPYTLTGWEIESISNPLYTSSDFALKTMGSDIATGTDVGTYPMNLTKDSFVNNNPNFPEVEFDVTDGWLKITPCEVDVQIEGHTATVVYNGTEQSVEGWDVKSISCADYTVDDFAMTDEDDDNASGVMVGEYPMNLSSASFENLDPNYTVRFAVKNGGLTITGRAAKVTVRAEDNTMVYSGDPLTQPAYTVTGELAEGDELVAVTEGSITNVGKADNVIAEYRILHGAEKTDVTAFYTNVSTEKGTLEVTQRSVILTSASRTKAYDGTPLTDHTVTVDDLGFVKNEGAAYTFPETSSITETGKVQNEFSYTLNEGTLAANYAITQEYGELEILPCADQIIVKVKGHTGTFAYDAAAHTVEGYDLSTDSKIYPLDAVKFSGKASVTRTDVGTSPMGLSEGDYSNTNGSFTNVVFQVEDGSIEITPPKSYQIVAGAEQVVLTTADSAKFASDADLSRFDHVEVDGKTVERKYYTAGSGSTVITFNRDFIKSLNVGKHTLRIVSTDGSADTEFFVESVPRTCDNSRIGLWLALLACAGTVLMLSVRTKKRNEE